MQRSLIAAVLAASCFFSTQALASQTIFYPTKEHADFSVTVPDNWELKEAEGEGGFFDLNGPTGALVSMRTIPGTAEDVDDAVKETTEWLDKNYKDVQLSEPKGEKGKSFKAGGTGKDKGDGHEVTFALAWVRLNDKTVIEVWACVDKGDEPGAKDALQILGSVKTQ